MQALLVNHNYDPTWLKDYPNLEVTLYDRSDDGVERNLTQYGKVIRTPNMGNVDLDKLMYLIENYDNLPDVFLWGKSNLFKFVDKDTLDDCIFKSEFAPLLKLDHKTYSDKYGVVCKYEDGIYQERCDSWYVHQMASRFPSYREWAHYMGLPTPPFLAFPPGGNFILTRERVHRYSVDFYQKMAGTLEYCQLPAEAHMAERTYYSLWK